MNAATVSRGVAAITDSVAGAGNGHEVFERVSDRLRRLVPFDGAAWFAVDPATGLASFPVRVENVEAGHCETYWERELQVEDVLLFRDLARSERAVGTLYDATGGHPSRSARHREFLAPQGYGDELRGALRIGSSTWGVVDVFRDKGRPAFSARDTEILRQVGPIVASALRGYALERSVAASAHDTPGMALYDETGGLLSLDEQAEHWLTELAGPAWHGRPYALTAIAAVVARAPVVAGGREREPASARLRTINGRWLIVQASCLRQHKDRSAGPIAVTIGPAKSTEIAPIIIEAYGLTAREQQITQAVARGLSNVEIAAGLHLSPHTVRDHLKAIFGKVDVGSRGELVAKLFAEHYYPAMHTDGAAVHTQR